MPDGPYLPWSTPPSGQGSQLCAWCDRTIYAPAVPCSTRMVPGLVDMEVEPGFGARCQYEARTRVPDLLTKMAREPIYSRPRPYPPE